MRIDASGLVLIEQFEGYSYKAYWDRWGHVWTVGFGETSGVGPSTTMTRAQATEDLDRRVTANYAPAVNALGVPLTQNQFNALCSFVWNEGPGSMSWDVGRLLRARDYLGAANALLHYDISGGVVLPGLVTRRQDERRLFLTPDPPPADPYHYVRFINYGYYLPAYSMVVRGRRISVRAQRWNERGTVRLYDRLRVDGQKNAHELDFLRVGLTLLRKRVWEIAHEGPTPDWAYDRGWRWLQLDRRSQGDQVH